MGGSNSTLSGSSFHSCPSNASSNTLSEVSDSSCSDISSRTESLLWDLEHNIHDGASVEDFVKHVFHVTPERINMILSDDWDLDPVLLSQYGATLECSASQDANPSLAFGMLVTDFAQRISTAIGGNFDSKALATHLRSTFISATAPEIISMPPPEAFYVDLTDEESDDGRAESGSASPDKSSTSDKLPNAQPPLTPVTSADLQLVAHAAEAMNAPGCHYTTCTAVQSFSITMWYYDRTCMARTIEFDLRHRRKEFALFAYSISHDPKISPTNRGPKGPLENALRPCLTTAGAQVFIHPDISGEYDAKFTIIESIYTDYALIGRGTKVFAVNQDRSDGVLVDEHVLKLAWPHAARPQEATLINTIVAAAPRWQVHLPQITFSATFHADHLLPRSRLLRTFSSKTFKDRYLHIMAMIKYQKLWEVNSVEEFQDVFVDCVECHFHSYEEGKILHCDLSENNLMCKRQPKGVRGVLNDWDMASPVNDQGDVSSPTASYATGTIPFMAYELLDANPPAHLYRHDLESFMYILIWAAIHYDFTGKQKLPVNPSLAGWNYKTRRRVRQAKGAFLFDPRGTSTIFQSVRPEFRPVLEQWIIPLHALFSSALASTTRRDIRTCDGRITFQAFMAVLGRKPR